MPSNKRSPPKFQIILSQLKPQIKGVNGDIWNPNFQIDVFDPNLYSVILARFGAFPIPIGNLQKKNKIFPAFYVDCSKHIYNPQQSFIDFINLIKMPSSNAPNYKDGLIRLITASMIINSNSWNYRNSTIFFFWDLLENSPYQNDIKNLITDQDLSNLEVSFKDTIYKIPKSIYQALTQSRLTNSNLIPPKVPAIQMKSNRFFRELNIKLFCEGEYIPTDHNFNPNQQEFEEYQFPEFDQNIKVCLWMHNPEIRANVLDYDNSIWQIMRNKTNLSKIKFNGILLRPQVTKRMFSGVGIRTIENKKSAYGLDRLDDFMTLNWTIPDDDISNFIKLDDYFDHIIYFNQKQNGNLLANIGKNLTYVSLLYLIYLDNPNETDQNLSLLLSEVKINQVRDNNIKFYYDSLITFLKVDFDKLFTKKLQNTNQILDIIYRKFKNLINKLNIQEASLIYFTMMQSIKTQFMREKKVHGLYFKTLRRRNHRTFYESYGIIKSPPPSTKIIFKEICQKLNDKIISLI